MENASGHHFVKSAPVLASKQVDHKNIYYNHQHIDRTLKQKKNKLIKIQKLNLNKKYQVNHIDIKSFFSIQNCQHFAIYC